MNVVKKALVSKEVKEAFDVLDELRILLKTEAQKTGHSIEAFESLYKQIEHVWLSDSKTVVSTIHKGISPRQLAYSAIANLAGDYLESGDYHMYRGVLNPLGLGNDFLNLFDMAVETLLKDGVISEKDSKEQKQAIRENIRYIG